MKLNYKIFLSFIITAFFVINLHGEFIPWNSDVKTGDAIYHFHDRKKKKDKLLNGAQCGAYFLVKFFQIVISPQDGPNCRHVPVCSAYARQAVIKHGAFLGSILAGDRLLRCNPYYPPEKDPVPEKVFK
jgi:putative membrane protein insertion efficiency factor